MSFYALRDRDGGRQLEQAQSGTRDVWVLAGPFNSLEAADAGCSDGDQPTRFVAVAELPLHLVRRCTSGRGDIASD